MTSHGKHYKITKFEFQWPDGTKIDIEPIPPEVMGHFAKNIKTQMEKKLSQSLGLPQHLLEGPASYSGTIYSGPGPLLHTQQLRMDHVLQREQAVCLIWGQLLAAGFKGNVRNLASSIWMAHECFERSLDALARHHRLGDWRFRRLA